MQVCGAKKRKGGTCTQKAGWGTDHVGYGRCKNHGGSTPPGARAGAKAAALAYAQTHYGTVDVHAEDSLLMCVRDTAGAVAFFKAQTAELDENDLLKDGKLHPWAQYQREATADLARYCKMALDAGVAARQVQLAERMGRLLAAAMERALSVIDDLDAKARQRAVVEFGKAIAELERADPDVVEGTTA